MFVNRTDELRALEEWWAAPRGTLGLVWGRRRVGKTALIQQFAQDRRLVFHTAAGRPIDDELRLLSRLSAPVLSGALRDLEERPFADWTDALETLAAAAADDPLLLVIDDAATVRKGIEGEDGYSAFSVRNPEDPTETRPTQLHGLLSDRGIDRVVVVGVATDYCVKETARDAARLAYETITLRAGIRAVDLAEGDGDAAIAAMEEAGVTIS